VIAEPFATALLLTTFGILLATSILFGRVSERIGVPIVLIFLVIGVIAGSEGLGGIEFADYEFAYRVGTAALVLILFDGGLNTSMGAMRSVLWPASVLATLGVIGTTVLVALCARLLGIDWPIALLIGAVVSSTDAAAVFAVLRGSGLNLKRRLGSTLEVESGVNDPMAVILTMVLTASLVEGRTTPDWTSFGVEIVGQIVLGLGGGVLVGRGGRLVLNRLRLPAGGLYPAFTLALAFLAYGVATLVHGSGFLAVYVAAVILGNGALPYRRSLVRVHDAVAWLSQISMFLILGLLVFPSRLVPVAWTGLALALFLTVVARPIVVALCLAPFGYKPREVGFIGWVGLRGAVPIILSLFPILAGAVGAERMFDLVFFIVVVNAFVPGMSVAWLTRRLGLGAVETPMPPAVLEIESMSPLEGELMSFYVDEALAVVGVPMSELPFPEGSAATLIVRGQQLIAPKGQTELLVGDHVYVFARPADRPFIQLMFGRPEGE
jgi:cell volume regulation protein A